MLALLGGIVLLAAVSWEIIGGDHHRFSTPYLIVQFVVCVLFLLDFFVRWASAPEKGRYFLRNCWFLLLSIPYLNIFEIGRASCRERV